MLEFKRELLCKSLLVCKIGELVWDLGKDIVKELSWVCLFDNEAFEFKRELLCKSLLVCKIGELVWDLGKEIVKEFMLYI